MGCELHLIGPIGFDLSEKALRRAGLDYWPHLNWTLHQDDDAFLDWLGDRKPWLVSKFGAHRYDQVTYEKDDIILMGNEVTGLPDAWHERWPDQIISIPIKGAVRSYNLANATAIVLAHAQLSCGNLDGISGMDKP